MDVTQPYNNIIRNLHERCLRLIYNEAFLTKDGSVSLYHRNIQALAKEFRKIKNGLLTELLTKTFACKAVSNYNLRRGSDFRITSIRTVYHVSESVCFLELKYGVFLPMKVNSKLL